MKLKENVEMIDGTMAHAYSISCGGKIYLVDTGTKGSGKKIIRFYESVGKEPDYVLITHYHMDHIGGLEQVMERYKPEVYVPSKEIAIIRHEQPLPEGTPAFLKLFGKVPRISDLSALRTSEELEAPCVKVMETFGHTPGSTSYYFPDEGVLLVGDAVYEKNGELAVNKLFSLDLVAAEEGRKKIMSMKPVMILPGHGNPISI